jgi:large subunit ribosomal protein L4
MANATKTTKKEKVVKSAPAAALEASVFTQDGKSKGSVALPADIFGLPWNADLVHQVITSMLSSIRRGTAHTKTRGEVRGGGKKPWQQKGTGRARHGSIRSPLWPGGGITHGPRNDKNYTRTVTKGMKAKALFTILSKKMRDGEVLFVDALAPKEAKTKEAKKLIGQLGTIKGFEMLALRRNNAAYIALPEKTAAVKRSFANFSNMEVDEVRNINPVDLMKFKYVVIAQPEESIKFLQSKVA